MAEFIVISTDNRLHYLVDGIERCRPLNNAIDTYISTGKIVKKENGYYYEYRIAGETTRSEGGRSFQDLIANQLAAFRNVRNLTDKEIVNVFLLVNPQSQEEYETKLQWLDGFTDVHNGGNGTDPSFRLFRIVFSYDLERPTDVVRQLDSQRLREIIERRLAFSSYVFYIDNQNSNAAALCLGKKEHDLMMPRFLTDFMMLVSNLSDHYNVFTAIHPPTVNTHVFSVGYAESMYYYPDVERYYHIADEHDLLWHCLTAEDEIGEAIDEKAMDTEAYPIGLHARQNRLAPLYEDVPFDEDIANHPLSADKKIDDCLEGLKEEMEEERERERREYADRLQSEIDAAQERLENMQQWDEETEDDFAQRKWDQEELVKALEQAKFGKIEAFEPECPQPIGRREVWSEAMAYEKPDDKEQFLTDAAARYNQVIVFATGKLREVIKEKKQELQTRQGAQSTPATPAAQSATGAERKGCLAKFCFWRKNNMPTEIASSPTVSASALDEILHYEELIRTIQKQRSLKSRFSTFKREVETVESECRTKQKEKDDFELSDHDSHFYHLIVLPKLMQEQQSDSQDRLNRLVSEWSETQKNRTFSNLKEMRKGTTQKHVKVYEYIDWDRPFGFVSTIDESTLAKVCNKLHRMSAPFVNYNLVTETAQNNVTMSVFSDRPNFDKEVEKIKDQLDCGLSLSASHSAHIASKICMFQFLPMDEDIINSLVDLQDAKNDADLIQDFDV